MAEKLWHLHVAAGLAALPPDHAEFMLDLALLYLVSEQHIFFVISTKSGNVMLIERR